VCVSSSHCYICLGTNRGCDDASCSCPRARSPAACMPSSTRTSDTYGERHHSEEPERQERSLHLPRRRNADVVERALHVLGHGPDAGCLLETLAATKTSTLTTDRQSNFVGLATSPRHTPTWWNARHTLLPPALHPRSSSPLLRRRHARCAELGFDLEQTELGLLPASWRNLGEHASGLRQAEVHQAVRVGGEPRSEDRLSSMGNFIFCPSLLGTSTNCPYLL
jgi:hypothetical protein